MTVIKFLLGSAAILFFASIATPAVLAIFGVVALLQH